MVQVSRISINASVILIVDFEFYKNCQLKEICWMFIFFFFSELPAEEGM